MVKYRFKKSILVKENKDSGALVFSVDNDQVCQFTGDSSLAVLLISKHSKNSGMTLQDLQLELAELSSSFKTNQFQEDCLNELFIELKKLDLLEPEA